MHAIKVRKHAINLPTTSATKHVPEHLYLPVNFRLSFRRRRNPPVSGIPTCRHQPFNYVHFLSSSCHLTALPRPTAELQPQAAEPDGQRRRLCDRAGAHPLPDPLQPGAHHRLRRPDGAIVTSSAAIVTSSGVIVTSSDVEAVCGRRYGGATVAS